MFLLGFLWLFKLAGKNTGYRIPDEIFGTVPSSNIKYILPLPPSLLLNNLSKKMHFRNLPSYGLNRGGHLRYWHDIPIVLWYYRIQIFYRTSKYCSFDNFIAITNIISGHLRFFCSIFEGHLGLPKCFESLSKHLKAFQSIF